MCEWWDSRAYISLIRKGPLQKFYSLTSIFNTSVSCTYKKKSSGRWLTLYRVKKSNIFLDSVSYRVSQQAEELKRHKMDKGWSDEHELDCWWIYLLSISYLQNLQNIYTKIFKTHTYLSIYLFIYSFIHMYWKHACHYVENGMKSVKFYDFVSYNSIYWWVAYATKLISLE